MLPRSEWLAAVADRIRLLDQPKSDRRPGDILETGGGEIGKSL
jgi:hypothetical protein